MSVQVERHEIYYFDDGNVIFRVSLNAIVLHTAVAETLAILGREHSLQRAPLFLQTRFPHLPIDVPPTLGNARGRGVGQ